MRCMIRQVLCWLLILSVCLMPVLAAPQDIGQGSGEITEDEGGSAVQPDTPRPDPEPSPEPDPEPVPNPEPEPDLTPDPQPEPTPTPSPTPAPEASINSGVQLESGVKSERSEPEAPDAYYLQQDGVLVDIWPLYTDMKPDRSDWFYRCVRDLAVAGVVGGYPDGSFQPQREVRWGEALKLILLSCGYDVQPTRGSHWADGYLAAAQTDGLLTTRPENLDAPITRLAYAQLAARAMGLQLVDLASPFADTDSAAVLALWEAKVIEGSFDHMGHRVFHPQESITRAELSAVLWRIRQYRGQ